MIEMVKVERVHVEEPVVGRMKLVLEEVQTVSIQVEVLLEMEAEELIVSYFGQAGVLGVLLDNATAISLL